ncbi:hypothetical protein SmJEL517_g03402 [Synchytrium microbalum]|uniref:Exportin-4 n=1 Tax=Synchytrium microbalum TaxID=1806994 RepID=A0A507C898_9FUNG|nr:uncharacterized protein SmJEL517_g03402 [Synchytrium microbalum]TPX33725.1 hypothetical protein SmJEL517_g03402 [Synchytrium microbalum]
MDYDSVLRTFEQACRDFQTPATRIAGERVLLQFRSTPGILSVCQYILGQQEVCGLSRCILTDPPNTLCAEHASHPLVQFEVAAAMKEAITREFTQHSKQEIQALRTYLIKTVVSRGQRYFISSLFRTGIGIDLSSPNSLPHYVREQLLQTAALLVKRGWLDATQDEMEAVIKDAADLLQGTVFEKKLSMSLLMALINEFSSGKASAIGLPWSFHYQCRKSFEKTELQHIFQMALQVLFTSLPEVTAISTFDESSDTGVLVASIVAVSETILQWEFTDTDNTMGGAFERNVLPDTNAAEDEAKSQVSVFPESWSALLVRPDVLDLFFLAYKALAKDSNAGNRARQCLIQLAGLHGRIFPNNDAQIAYAAHFLDGLMRLLQEFLSSNSDHLDDESGPELIGIVQMSRRLLTRFPIPILGSSPHLSRFLEDMSVLTRLCLRQGVGSEASWCSEAAEELLETWSAFVTDANQLSGPGYDALKAYLQAQSGSIFTTYVDAQMETARVTSEEEDGIDEDDMGFKDQEMYSDQLISAAALARNSPRQSLDRMMLEISARVECVKRAFEGQSAENLSIILEQTHWLTLIAGYILADSGVGEQPLVPSSLASLSNEVAAEANPTLILPNMLFGLLKYVTVDPSLPQMELCSPLVAESLLWLVERWSRTYLFLNADEQHPRCPTIIAAFGVNDNGSRILEVILDMIHDNLVLWVADPDVTAQIVRMLNTFPQNKMIRHSLLESEKFQGIATFILNNLHRIPAIVHTSLIQTIATIASHAATEEARLEYFTGLNEAVQKRLLAVIQLPNFSQVCHRPEIILQVVNTLELYIGLAQSQDMATTSLVFAACAPYLGAFVHLVDVYHNSPEVEQYVLQFFEAFVRNAVFTQLQPSDMDMLTSTLLNLFTTFGKTGIGKSRSAEVGQEDELFEDVSSLLRLMSSLMESGLSDGAGESVARAKIGDVVFHGVNTVIPLISAEMLKYPQLGREYVPLVSRLVQYFPERLIQLPAPLLSSLVKSLIYGFDATEYEIARSAFEAAMTLAIWSRKPEAIQDPALVYIQPHLDSLLSEILQCLLFKEFDPDLIESAGEAFFVLTICRNATYIEFVRQLVDSREDVAIKSRLSAAFVSLNQVLAIAASDVMTVVTSTSGTFLRGSKFDSFRSGLVDFLVNVRGFLRVK